MPRYLAVQVLKLRRDCSEIWLESVWWKDDDECDETGLNMLGDYSEIMLEPQPKCSKDAQNICKTNLV